MKVLIIGTAYPYRGGLAAFNERLARQFTDEGCEVEIITFTLQYPSFLFPGKTQYSTDSAPSGLHVSRLVNSVNPFNRTAVGKQLAKRQADVAVISYWMPFMAPCLGTIAREIRKYAKTKVVAVLHNVIPHEPHFFDLPLSRYFVKSVDAFVYMSRSVGEDLKRLDNGGRQAAFSPHPVYDTFGEQVPRTEALKSLGLDAGKRYLLFFGFIRDYKGLDLLMRAMSLPQVRGMEDVELVVAGEFYGNEQKYKDLERNLGLTGRVRWYSDFIPDNKVKLFFSAADIVVQPYKSATQSGVTQIAYHFEKPMLVTNVGGLAEIVPDGKAGYVVAPDPAAIGGALCDFFQKGNPDCFLQGIKVEKSKYSWGAMTRTIMEC